MRLAQINSERFLGVLLFLLLFVALNSATAQIPDSAWYLEWEQVLEGRSGGLFQGPPFQMWIGDGRARVKLDDEQYFTIIGDTINIVDTYAKAYSKGPVDQLDMAWITMLDFLWKMRRAPGVTYTLSNRREEVAGIPGRGMSVTLKGSKLMQPMRMDMLVGLVDDLPIPDSEFNMFYIAFTASNTDKSVDFVEISDTLKAQGLFPLSTSIISLVPNDTSAIFKTKLSRIERVAVPVDFFSPPHEYKGNVLRSPTEAERWELTAIPLPGGPRKK
ncbi:MAG: hypothetical protein J4G05_02285 [Chlorobi bacterium]|nr:hypothetical protein [Chlorobiota bacterium]